MSKYENIADAPLGVRKRYFQIRYAKYFMAIGRFYSRIFLTIKEWKKNRVLTNTLQTYKIETERARSKGNECIQVLMNIGLYYLIAEKDIQTVKIDALTHHNKWKRLLSLRIILLTIYEWDMGKASSKNLKDLLCQSSVEEELQKELFRALRLLRKSQEKAAKLLHFERNSMIAHRDSDALLQLNTIQNLNTKKVFTAASDFYESSAIFMRIFPKVMLQAGSMKGLFSFMLNANKT
jgi:hypothetical protein